MDQVRFLRLAAVGAAALLTTSGCGLFGGDDPVATPDGPTTPATPPRPPGPPEAVAKQYLERWAAGDDAGAAQLTDAPDSAAKVLADFRAQLPIAAIKAEGTPTPGRPGAVPVTVNIDLVDAGTWTFGSQLLVIDAKGQWRVAWAPSVVHPKLTAGAALKVTEVPARSGATTVVDRNGTPLSGGEHPSLAPSILPAILRAAPAIPGPPGKAVQLVERTGAVTTLEQVRPAGAGGAAASTLDAGIQTQAQAALGMAPLLSSAVVVLQAGTGNILAMASNPPNGRLATHADRPPGSAFKIVVASALLAAGDSPDTAVPCDASYTIPNGRTFKNNTPGDTNPGASLAFDFAVSCNTAFVAHGMKRLTPPQRLFDHAAQVYGLTGEWDIGLGSPTAYWELPNPGANRDLWGEDLLGQGGLTVEPLAMASVVATASTGTFRQPVIIPGAKPTVTTRVRAPADGLRRMMRQTVSSGTASALQGLGDVGAKTGTADVTGGNVNWMVAYRGDIAIACQVQGLDGSGGNATAGPIVARLLKSI